MIGMRPTQQGPGVLRVHAWLVLLSVIMTVGWAAVFTAGQQSFTATSEVLALPTATSGGAPTAPDMGTEREVASSGEVAELAAEDLGATTVEALRGLSVSVVTDTNVLTISYTAADAGDALAGVQAFTRAFVEYRNSAQTARAARVITEPEMSDGGSVLTSWQVVLVAAIGLGLALGAGAAWLWDRATGRVRTRAELEATGVPVMACLDGFGDGFGLLAAQVTSITDRRRRGVLILVTGTDPLSDSSDVALNAARALAALGRQVVLVDADVRTAGLTGRLKLPAHPGLLDLLDGRGSVEQAARATGIEGLRVVTSAATATPPPAFDLDGVSVVLGQLASQAIVVVDAPRLPDCPEMILMAQEADVVLLVARLGRSERRAVQEAASLVRRTVKPCAPVATLGWVVCAGRYHPPKPETIHPAAAAAAAGPDDGGGVSHGWAVRS